MRVRLSTETLRNEVVRRIEEISGEDLLKCYQCGKCAAGCPAAFAMDMLPSQVIRFAQLGLVEEVLDSQTPQRGRPLAHHGSHTGDRASGEGRPY
jgi:heterodisulfide reductase subunit C